LPRVSAASCPPTDLSTHTQGTCRPLSNLSTTTNDSRSLCRNAQQNTPPRHPQAFGLSAMKKDMLRRKIKGGCRRRAGTRCLGRISSQTAWAKVAQERAASNAGTTAHTNKDIGKKDYSAQNQISQPAESSPSDQISSPLTNTCFAKPWSGFRNFVQSTPIRRD
jgi:hypothetical protein